MAARAAVCVAAHAVVAVEELADRRGVPARILEVLGERGRVGQRVAEGGRERPGARLVGPSAAHERLPRRRAPRKLGVGTREENSVGSQFVDRRRERLRAVRAERGPQVVGDDEEHVLLSAEPTSRASRRGLHVVASRRRSALDGWLSVASANIAASATPSRPSVHSTADPAVHGPPQPTVHRALLLASSRRPPSHVAPGQDRRGGRGGGRVVFEVRRKLRRRRRPLRHLRLGASRPPINACAARRLSTPPPLMMSLYGARGPAQPREICSERGRRPSVRAAQSGLARKRLAAPGSATSRARELGRDVPSRLPGRDAGARARTRSEICRRATGRRRRTRRRAPRRRCARA